MKKIYIFLVIILFCCRNFVLAQCTNNPSQAWNWAKGASQTSQARFFGNRYIAYDEFHNIYSLAQLEGGTVTIGGITVNSYYGNDHILVKQDQDGNVLWAKTFGTSQNDFLTSIGGMVCDQKGSVFIAMSCSDLHINGVFQPVTNIWQDDIIQFDYDGNFVADVYQSGRMRALEYYNDELYFSDHYIVRKKNAQGDILPVLPLQPDGDIFIWNIKHAPNGDMVVYGYFSGSVSYGGTTVYTKPGFPYSEFLFRVSATGNLIYGFSMDGTTNSLSNLGIAFDSYSNLLMTAQPQSNPWHYNNTSLSINYPVTTTAMLLKFDAVNGNMIWNRQFATFGSQMGYGQSLICNPNNEILILGNYHTTGVIPYAYCLPDYQNFILKLNENGEKMYFQNFGMSGNTNSGIAFTTWDYCKYFIAGLGGDINTTNNAKFNCLSYTYEGSYFTASFNDHSFEINGNGIDDDCDDQIDENVPDYKLWYRDVDEDGFGDQNITTYACSAPAGYVGNGDDCDDNNDQIGFTHWYKDIDGDGYGDADDAGIASCSSIPGKVSNNNDCDDNNDAIHPGANEVCNGIDDNCDGVIDQPFISGLKMYLPFDGNARDITGNNHNGKIYNATPAADRFGNANKAYYFNGVNAHIDVRDDPVFRSPEITMGCWVNTNNPANKEETVLSKTIGNGFYNSFSTGYTYSSGQVGGFFGGEGYYNQFSGNGATNRTWFYLVWSYSDANNISKLYVNGNLVASQSTSISLGFDDKPFVIGGEYSFYPGLDYLLEGMVDDVVFFDRFLSDAEVASLYQNGPFTNIAAAEVCNGVDDDCDGLVDEGFSKSTFYKDADNDGYGDEAVTIQSCSLPEGYVENSSDCDDDDDTKWQSSTVYIDDDGDNYDAGTTTICYGTNIPPGYSATTSGSDCNDEDANIHTPVQYYIDNDHDNYGSAATEMLCSSTAPTGYSTNNTDCNDNDASIHTPVQYYIDNDQDSYGSAATEMLCSSTASTGYSTNNTDCNDNDASLHENCSCTVTANCTTNTPDNTLYFGYAGDQSSTITVTPSGGLGPYTIEITLSRPLLCNQINDAGDETWISENGGTTINNSCPVNPNLATLAPVSAKTISTGSYSVKVALMQDADVIATITDARGCKFVSSVHIDADDVRCFAGKSNISKVTICHKTGSAKNPCVKICVNEEEVAEHLAHGDFMGKCTVDCQPPSSSKTSSDLITKNSTKKLNVRIMPNPVSAYEEFTLIAQGDENETLDIRVMNEYGQVVYKARGSAGASYRFGRTFSSGVYIVQVIQAQTVQTFKIVKGKG